MSLLQNQKGFDCTGVANPHPQHYHYFVTLVNPYLMILPALGPEAAVV